MEAIVNLFLGDPIYDRNGQMVKRDFGVKNILMIVVVGYIGYSLMCKNKVFSGKRKGKMKGGTNDQTVGRALLFVASVVCIVVGVLLLKNNPDNPGGWVPIVFGGVIAIIGILSTLRPSSASSTPKPGHSATSSS